jgi:hypothetical protein
LFAVLSELFEERKVAFEFGDVDAVEDHASESDRRSRTIPEWFGAR